ncbi:XdhC family protein [Aquimarina brevivitae]|uniref:Xanthine/CO dehydrogenase XdhC/CoxF family maturation factor n=1 Tax=Aquimarina brevivitae TaxID=323412 RepID=A0A4V2F4W0_9FLAO|nr:XdhC/CoxI family protein [Aquimarina brevivitae]RZS90689.1 xanthine/CO dehydrogenase XdhC/CoxF family maturation factor [Aquimarina brevivitae]
MTHEFKEILTQYAIAKQLGKATVLATVVYVEGSSYRRPGVRMLIREDGVMTGAVSGGCVEKEVLRQAQAVFTNKTAKMMTYDGKYRLGCEGVLYILIEPLDLSTTHINTLKELLGERKTFDITSTYSKSLLTGNTIGSVVTVNESESNKEIPFYPNYKKTVTASSLENHKDKMNPCMRLVIIGTEHDSVSLCKLASLSGWEVVVVGAPSSPQKLTDFTGATEFKKIATDSPDFMFIDEDTVVVLMTHNFAKDALYLQALSQSAIPSYIGLLGPAQRREKLLNALIEYNPETPSKFLERIHGPAGLNIGAETPQEIAISILSEILALHRNQNPIFLQDKKGAIHDPKESIAISKA